MAVPNAECSQLLVDIKGFRTEKLCQDTSCFGSKKKTVQLHLLQAQYSLAFRQWLAVLAVGAGRRLFGLLYLYENEL